ncbi:uncharacterized protein Aud_001909 [Aspergillus udagawae]|uniref:Uncharacterized protein n=1 Tax=Aspergillus udagawae TaxID=91492 RepID=A0A8E0R1U8_9EURO|nr:uncharacterized protein Aud_001909 [Aspergillus udagawae]GIC94580.1 hypothetical protein Aud_001909 [Aspergillus udagawae]
MPIKRSQTPAPSHAARCLRAGASAAAAATVFGPGSPASSSDDPLVALNARGRLHAVESSGSFSCQRCFKDAMRNDEVCAWVRHASYRKCKRCQRLGKPCEKIPLQCCRRAAVWNDPATNPIIYGYINLRANNYAHEEKIKGVIKNTVVEWSQDYNVLPVLLAPAAPRAGVLGVKENQVPELTVLWFVVQLMRAKGSLFPQLIDCPGVGGFRWMTSKGNSVDRAEGCAHVSPGGLMVYPSPCSS